MPKETLTCHRGKLHPQEAEYVNDIYAALQNKDDGSSRALIWLLLSCFIAFILWAYSTQIDEVATGTGKVIPSSRDYIVQSLEGGILAEIYVHEGQQVQEGQALLRLDETHFKASYNESYKRYLSLLAASNRLEAESQGTALRFHHSIKKALPSAIQRETQLYRARQRELQESLSSLRTSLKLLDRELTLNQPLVAQGILAETQVLQLKRQINDLKLNINERKNQFRSEAQSALNKALSEIVSIQEINKSKEDQFTRTTIRAGASGKIKNIKINTPGAVIQPGQEIMQVVPIEDTLIIETKVQPSDIAFVQVGMPASVQISAYEYTRYGSLKGKVSFISPNTISTSNIYEEPFFLVHVEIDQTFVTNTKLQRKLPIIPGMTASVDIITGKNTVLHSLIQPLSQIYSKALKESH